MRQFPTGAPYREAQNVADAPVRAHARARSAGLGWLRAAALVIDYGLAMFVTALLGAFGMIAGERNFNQGALIVFTVVLVGVSLVLTLGRDSLRGRSAGRRLLGLQVVDDATGRPASPLRCAARNLISINLAYLDAILLCVWSDGRALGDRLLSTRVISLDRGAELGSGTRVVRTLGIALAVFLLMSPLWFLLFEPAR